MTWARRRRTLIVVFLIGDLLTFFLRNNRHFVTLYNRQSPVAVGDAIPSRYSPRWLMYCATPSGTR